jgi:predicted GNAT family acetyltransferase
MTHMLDRPIWSALTTRHAALAHGGALAKRYEPSVAAFAASADDGEESLTALAGLVRPGEGVLVLGKGTVVTPSGLTTVSRTAVVQMIATQSVPPQSDADIAPLGWADAQHMLDLATLTRPGPFTLKALSFGDFWGIKKDGVLIAMAGERMKQPGLTELSGVSVHPDHRGEGLGRRMSVYVARKIIERGDQPYLHAYATNTTAIRLYESIGFGLRADMQVAKVERAV